MQVKVYLLNVGLQYNPFRHFPVIRELCSPRPSAFLNFFSHDYWVVTLTFQSISWPAIRLKLPEIAWSTFTSQSNPIRSFHNSGQLWHQILGTRSGEIGSWFCTPWRLGPRAGGTEWHEITPDSSAVYGQLDGVQKFDQLDYHYRIQLGRKS